MLNLLSGNSAVSPSPLPAVVPQPRFRPLIGRPRNVKYLRESPVVKGGVGTGAQYAGLRYETKVKLHLNAGKTDIRQGVWFSFEDDSGPRICQVDALELEHEEIVIFEIKATHSIDAWQQLRMFYQPIVKAWRPNWKVRVLEICKSFDPMVLLPERPILLKNLGSTLEKDHYYVFRFQV